MQRSRMPTICQSSPTVQRTLPVLLLLWWWPCGSQVPHFIDSLWRSPVNHLADCGASLSPSALVVTGRWFDDTWTSPSHREVLSFAALALLNMNNHSAGCHYSYLTTFIWVTKDLIITVISLFTPATFRFVEQLKQAIQALEIKRMRSWMN